MMAQYHRLILAEWKEDFLKGITLSSRDRILADELMFESEPKLLVEELREGLRIKARSWVGVVRFEEFEVHIEPKLAGDQIGLINMINFTAGLDALSKNSGARSIAIEGVDLFDLIALLLVEACEGVVRKGLFADYVECEDNLPVVRGRLLGDRQILRRFGQIDRLECRFDEQQYDSAENQLLGVALRACGRRVIHGGVRRRAKELQAIFENICDPAKFDGESAGQMLVYHRLNEHYREAHEIARFVLDGLGIHDVFAKGDTTCFAFLIDMNTLFERFVYRLIDRLLPRDRYRVGYQHASKSIIQNAVSEKPYSRVIPDLLIQPRSRPNVRIAMDAKYKIYDERKISPEDVYQTFVYAYAYGGAAAATFPAAILIYPSSTGAAKELRLRIRSTTTSARAQIIALGIPIPAALADVEDGVCGDATKALLNAIEELESGLPSTGSKAEAGLHVAHSF
jgi:5-methylcytosine-specific restriction enzyme subunit McrC